MKAADKIAAHLCDTAFISKKRCTWMGTTQSAGEDSELVLAYETIGPTLYGGCSGVAVFLAEMFRRTKKTRYRAVALGAIEQALHRAPDIRDGRPAFFTGWIGVAYAATRVGLLCENADIVERAAEMANATLSELPEFLALDVIEGLAGSAPALLWLSVRLESPALADVAKQLGDRLLASATVGDRGWSWGGRDEPIHLTGFAHGAAGVSWSLGELHRAFGDGRLLEGARRAVEYENSWYQPDADNWADLREAESLDSAQTTQSSFGMGWCAGAPGIGLSRLRLFDARADPRLRQDVDAAIRSSKRALRDLEPARGFDYSLCHGRGGICEFLLLAARALGDAEAEQLVVQTALNGVEEYGKHPDLWPTGVLRGTNPSLMLGTAGIGLFLLRLVDRSVPSVLLIEP